LEKQVLTHQPARLFTGGPHRRECALYQVPDASGCTLQARALVGRITTWPTERSSSKLVLQLAGADSGRTKLVCCVTPGARMRNTSHAGRRCLESLEKKKKRQCRCSRCCGNVSSPLLRPVILARGDMIPVSQGNIKQSNCTMFALSSGLACLSLQRVSSRFFVMMMMIIIILALLVADFLGLRYSDFASSATAV
jgi:hypothetical protein